MAEQKLLWKVIIKQFLLIHLNSTVYSKAGTVVGLTQGSPLPVVNFPVKQRFPGNVVSWEWWALLPAQSCLFAHCPSSMALCLSTGCLTHLPRRCASHTQGMREFEIWEVFWRWKTLCLSLLCDNGSCDFAVIRAVFFWLAVWKHQAVCLAITPSLVKLILALRNR